MIVYGLAFGLSLLLCLGADLTVRNMFTSRISPMVMQSYGIAHRYLLLCAPLPILFITCLRYNVGYDYTPTYLSDYYLYRDGGDVHSDFGFNVFYWISQRLSKDPQVLFIITGLVMVLAMFAASYLLTKTLSMMLVLFLFDDSYFRSISMVAQYLAIALLVLAFALLFHEHRTKRQTAFGLLLLVAAPCIHFSGIVVSAVLLLLFLLDGRGKRLFMWVSLILPILVFLFRQEIMEISVRLMAATRYGSYINSGFQGLDSMSALGVEFIFLAAMLLAAFINEDRLKPVQSYAVLLESLGLSFALLQGVPLMFRITFYFAAFHIITFPLVLDVFRNRVFMWGLFLMVLGAVFIWFVYYPLAGNYDSFLPYAFVFNQFHLYW